MRVKRSRDVAWREVGGNLVVVQLDRRMMYCLNGPGASLWNALDEPLELDRLGEILASVADGAGRISRAVRAFVHDLLKEGLIEFDGSAAPPAAWGDTPPASPEDPRIAWREQMNRPSGTCAFQPGQTELCKQQPYNS